MGIFLCLKEVPSLGGFDPIRTPYLDVDVSTCALRVVLKAVFITVCDHIHLWL